MLRNRRRYLGIEIRLLVCLAIAAALMSERSLADPTQLMITPVEEKADRVSKSRDIKVCLVVRDQRDPSVVNVEMIGLGPKGGAAVLRNRENLQTILAHDLADRLTHAGYEVVKTYPTAPKHLSSEYRNPTKVDKKDLKAARNAQNKELRKKARLKHRKLMEEGAEPIEFRETSGAVSPQGGDGWTGGADFVLEVSIIDFTSYIITGAFTGTFLGTTSVTLTVASGESENRREISVTEVNAMGSVKGLSVKAFPKTALNKTYKHLIDAMESLFLSDDFEDVVGSMK